MPRSDKLRIRDIIDAGARIQRHIAGLDRETFAASDTVMRAVLFDLAVIGEAAKGVSVEERARFAEVPWADMAGMRDVVVHQYFGIDASVVWNAATVSVPSVIDSLTRPR